MIRLCQRARTLDPLNAQPYARLGTAYLYLGRLPEAEAAVRRRLDLTPEGNGAHTQLGDVLLAGGRAQAALAAVEQEPDEEMRLVGLALAYHALGRHADADAALKSLRGQYETRYPVEIAEVLTFRGETDRAFEALGEAFSVGDPALNELKTDNYFTPLHADARYAALLKRLNLPP
jgi:tetratricopeptide (TPR) repeat protein